MKPLALALALMALPTVAMAEEVAVGMSFTLGKGDDPVEAFAGRGASLAGASYVFSTQDGSQFRADRAAVGRKGIVVISRLTRPISDSRGEWTVVSVLAAAIDSTSVMTSECKGGTATAQPFAYYTVARDGHGIGKVDAAFQLDAQSGKVATIKLAPKDCEPRDTD